MTRVRVLVLVTVLLAGFAMTGLQSAGSEQAVDIWMAATTGNLDAIEEHVAAGADINAQGPVRRRRSRRRGEQA